jgi:hypothetical protein
MVFPFSKIWIIYKKRHEYFRNCFQNSFCSINSRIAYPFVQECFICIEGIKIGYVG